MKVISGYIGSGFVHVAVAAVLIAAAVPAWNRAEHVTDCSWHYPGIEVTDTGSGGAAPVATPAPVRRPLPGVPVLDAASMVDALEAEARARESPVEKRDVRTVKKPPVARVSSAAPVRATTVSAGISGARLDPIDGPAGGGPSGPSASSGTSGTRTVSAQASDAYAAEVRAAFDAVYRPLFESRGAAIAADSDSGEVRLVVSPAGVVGLREWVVRPASEPFARIVADAVAGMRRVGAPPSGRETVLRLRVTGNISDS